MKEDYITRIFRIATDRLDEPPGKGHHPERCLYQHIARTCTNRIRVIRNPKRELEKCTLSGKRYRNLVNKLNQKQDEESKMLFRYCTQGINGGSI